MPKAKLKAKKKEHPDVVVRMSHHQLRVLEQALDIFTRICIGQLHEVAHVVSSYLPKEFKGDMWEMRKELDRLTSAYLGLSPGASFGIPSDKVHDDAKIAYDLEKTFQKHIAVVEDHDRWSVWHNGNLLHLGSESCAKVEVDDERTK